MNLWKLGSASTCQLSSGKASRPFHAASVRVFTGMYKSASAQAPARKQENFAPNASFPLVSKSGYWNCLILHQPSVMGTWEGRLYRADRHEVVAWPGFLLLS